MLQLHFDPFPALDTGRLTLRRLNVADSEKYFQLRTNPDVMRFIERPQPASVQAMEKHIIKVNEDVAGNKSIVWAITDSATTEMIGSISYHKIIPEHYRAEIGYLLHPSYWRAGYMSEAIDAVINYGFGKMKLHSIEAIINPLNTASRNILSKFGFIKEGYFKENFYFEGKFLDSEVYSLITPSS